MKADEEKGEGGEGVGGEEMRTGGEEEGRGGKRKTGRREGRGIDTCIHGGMWAFNGSGFITFAWVVDERFWFWPFNNTFFFLVVCFILDSFVFFLFFFWLAYGMKEMDERMNV